MVEIIEGILTIEGMAISSYPLKLKEKPKVSIGYRYGLILTHNPKVTGSNPVPATKNFRDLHSLGVGPFSLVGYFWALFF